MKISTFASSLFLAALSSLSFSVVASAEDTVYSRYADRAERLANDAESLPADAADADAAALTKLQASNATLATQGATIMKLYGKKFAECAAQYEDFEAKIPQLAKLSAEEIEVKYHDGEDLAAAPSHCYFGRSLVIDPAMNAARLADGVLTAAERPIFIEESLEVVSHVRRVEKRIQQP